MPRRYEEPDCREFAQPRADTTWIALNEALGYHVPNQPVGRELKNDGSVVAPTNDSQGPYPAKGLTIADAKAGLASSLGVSVDCIEIIIRS
jgi:hypothetical protein